RGNVVSSTTCQNLASNACSTTYLTYYPDDTSSTLTPDPRNDLVLTVRDPRSPSASDNAYLTTYAYDPPGNRPAVTTPPAPRSTAPRSGPGQRPALSRGRTTFRHEELLHLRRPRPDADPHRTGRHRPGDRRGAHSEDDDGVRRRRQRHVQHGRGPDRRGRVSN